MTAELLTQALVAAGEVSRNLGYHNTEFRHGFLEEIPVDSETADLVTSNCVVNLSTDKPKVFQEIARILKHGGRFVISDIIAETPVPEELQKDKELWGECLVGALTEAELLKAAEAAGLYGLEIMKRRFYKAVEGYNFYAVTVRGWKFKKGPECVYIGQMATYLGPYSEVTDDDGHTYKRGVPFEVCTDTAAKLKLPPYGGQFTVDESALKITAPKTCCSSESGGCC
jgi:SAM-dependent methyltransferase